jgi:hypothetical protein
VYPDRHLVVVLTGTDAYRFIHSHRETTLASLEAADHLVGLHRLVGNVLRGRLLRAESDREYYAELVAAGAVRRHLFTPEQVQAGWEKLVEDIEASGAL